MFEIQFDTVKTLTETFIVQVHLYTKAIEIWLCRPKSTQTRFIHTCIYNIVNSGIKILKQAVWSLFMYNA